MKYLTVQKDIPTPHLIDSRGHISSSRDLTECGQTTIGDVLMDIAMRPSVGFVSGNSLDSVSAQAPFLAPFHVDEE